MFSEHLGCYNGPPVKLSLNKDAQPTFCKARPVPFALRSKVEDELLRLQSQGIISPVKHSVWAAPIVPVLKKNGKVCLCGDNKLTVNLTPLYSLLGKHKKWHWGQEQQSAFQLAKDALQSDTLLVHYDPGRPILLACDASDYGIGAVLSHTTEDSQERLIAFISRTLTSAEKHYSQLEKEALAIIFAVKKFHHFLFGRHFVIESDHQPLKALFGESKKIPPAPPPPPPWRSTRNCPPPLRFGYDCEH